MIVVEVKTRSRNDLSDPLRAVDSRKIAHISQGARGWIQKAAELQMAVRFDVITVIVGDSEYVEHHLDVASV